MRHAIRLYYPAATVVANRTGLTIPQIGVVDAGTGTVGVHSLAAAERLLVSAVATASPSDGTPWG
jgi:hypothetical protein